MPSPIRTMLDPDVDPRALAERNGLNKLAWDRLYGRTPRLIWGERPLEFVSALVPELCAGLPPAPRLLDAGTGEGRNLPALLRVPGARVHACDASRNALRKIPPRLRERVELHHCDLVALPFPDSHFDLVLIVDVLETVPEADRVMDELARVLRPGGMLLGNVPGEEDGIFGQEMVEIAPHAYLFRDTYYFRFMDEEEATRLFASHGFAVRRSELRSWVEDPHPEFRAGEHVHTSRTFVAERAR